jgi:flagellar assembly protein FliH
MSEKIILNKSAGRIRNIKLNEPFDFNSPVEEEKNRQKEIEIELHNHFIKGFREGQKEAINRLQKEFNEKLKEAHSIFDSIYSKIDSQLIDQFQKINRFIIDISFQIAEKIIRREIEKSSPVLKIIDESLRKIISANETVIKLNPQDMSLVESGLSEIGVRLNSSNIRLEADERIERGGCLIETEIGNVDGRISSQVENLKRQIETYFEGNDA